MKKNTGIITVILVVLFLFTLVQCKNKLAGDDRSTNYTIHLIELRVDTESISNGGDIEQYCSFKGQQAGVPDSLFTTEVKKGDIIVWAGVSTESLEDLVEITQINYARGDRNLLGKPVINGTNGVVAGRILTDAVAGEEEKYMLRFKVGNKNYKIDPKLRVMP